MSLVLANPNDRPIIEEILAKVGGETMITGGDLSVWLERGFFLLDEDKHGLFWCSPIELNTLEVHATFDHEHRGEYAMNLALEAQRKLFTELLITRMLTKCKLHHKNVVAFSRWIGFREIGIIGDNRILECGIDNYIINDIGLSRLIRNFPMPDICPQEQLNYAGFFMECARKGMLIKGIEIYNRMASLLGWQPLLATSYNPILLSIGDRQFSPTEVPTEA